MKKNPQFEAIAPAPGSSLYIENLRDFNAANPSSWHYHPEMEIVYINGGSGKRQIGNHISYYNDGDLIFIGASLPHFGFTNHLTNNKSEIVIQAREDFLGPEFFEAAEFAAVKQLLIRSKQGIVYSEKTKSRLGPKIEALLEMNPFDRLINFLALLNELALAKDYTLLNADHIILETKPQDAARLDVIYNFVSQSFTRPISLTEMADKVSMTPQAFSRYFKNKTGKTFIQFVTEYRVTHACKLLAEGALSITDVCFESGFNNFSHFNKTFKSQTGKSPSHYRNELRQIL